MQNYSQLIDFLISPEAKVYVKQNAGINVAQLALSRLPFAKPYQSFILDQISARQKLRDKLPFWLAKENIILPPTLSVQQCSSQATALFKARLLDQDWPKNQNQTFADLSTGLGVDAWAIAMVNQNNTKNQLPYSDFYLNEPNPWLAALLAHNMEVLGMSQMKINCQKAEDFAGSLVLKQCQTIFADPDRRSAYGQKLYKPEDFSPNIIPIFEKFLKNKKSRTLLKISPMADIRQMLECLVKVKKIVVVGSGQECKELLFLSDNESNLPINQVPICLALPDAHGECALDFKFSLEQEKQLESKISALQKYIFLPHAAAIKTGGFKSLAAHYGVWGLHPHTHVYTNDTQITNWPGRSFKVLEHWPYKSDIVRAELKGRKPVFFLRNFPDPLPKLLNKLGQNSTNRDSGPIVAFALTLNTGKPAIILAQEIGELES